MTKLLPHILIYCTQLNPPGTGKHNFLTAKALYFMKKHKKENYTDLFIPNLNPKRLLKELFQDHLKTTSRQHKHYHNSNIDKYR